MLELAHKLADSDSKFFGGWVLAGAEVHIHGKAQQLENNILLEKQRKCIMQVLGTAADGSEVKELQVFLVLPQNSLGTKTAAASEPQGQLLCKHSFSVQDVRAYVGVTGDENIIHQGKHPVIPGLCMAAWLQQKLQLTELDWRISFLAPVFAGDELCVYGSKQELQGYVGSSKVFTIKI